MPLPSPFEIKLAFLQELDAGFGTASEALAALKVAPEAPEALQHLRQFFHRVAGTAEFASLPMLGHLAAMGEASAVAIHRGELQPVSGIRLFERAMVGVASVLSSRGDEDLAVAPANLAGILQALVRTSDVVTRFGGEEFALILLECTDAEATIIAERIRDRIAHYRFALETPALAIPVTASLGLTQYRHGDTVDELLKYADDALYRSKRQGRNRVSVAARA
jgi:hypothetical protein